MLTYIFINGGLCHIHEDLPNLEGIYQILKEAEYQNEGTSLRRGKILFLDEKRLNAASEIGVHMLLMRRDYRRAKAPKFVLASCRSELQIAIMAIHKCLTRDDPNRFETAMNTYLE
jgi:hypothetical protein